LWLPTVSDNHKGCPYIMRNYRYLLSLSNVLSLQLPHMNDIAQQHAMVLFEQAYRLHRKGHLSEAIELYKKSVEICPTAEACTFLGWSYSMVGRYDEAIEWCKQAISLDPTYGNPYNDIGSYLIETGQPQEALPWLEKAAVAPLPPIRVCVVSGLTSGERWL
jgi:tetratricopeptide (TPR) repeat protein